MSVTYAESLEPIASYRGWKRLILLSSAGGAFLAVVTAEVVLIKMRLHELNINRTHLPAAAPRLVLLEG